MNIVEYSEAGRILSVINYPVSDEAVTEVPLYQGRLFLPQGCHVDWTTQYVKDDELVERPGMQVTLEGDKLKGVPADAVITIDEAQYVADGSAEIELEFDKLSTYKIMVSLWPYLDAEFIYENLAQD